MEASIFKLERSNFFLEASKFFLEASDFESRSLRFFRESFQKVFCSFGIKTISGKPDILAYSPVPLIAAMRYHGFAAG